MNKVSFLLPLVVFAVVVAIFLAGFNLNDRHDLPSPLIGKPFPAFTSTSLAAPHQEIGVEDLIGRPTLVNVWATWCPTCFSEHEMLMKIAATGAVRVVGINYKDDRAKALTWLADYGNPYDLVIEDADGSLGIELGVYGAPETFLLDANGAVIYKRVGDVNERIWRDEIQPRLAQLAALRREITDEIRI